MQQLQQLQQLQLQQQHSDHHSQKNLNQPHQSKHVQLKSSSPVPVPVPAPSTPSFKDIMSAYTENEQLVFGFIKNIILNLILTIKPLRIKLEAILNQPDLICVEVFKVYEENKASFTPTDIENIKTIVSSTNSVTELNRIFLDAFTKIMEDGKIDMNDSVHFMTFMHEVVRLFNDYTTNQSFRISLSADSVLHFLHVIIKSILLLTLDHEEERVAVSMLDASMKLIQIAVLPITKCNCSCFSFKRS
jgi:hypothetical protein